MTVKTFEFLVNCWCGSFTQSSFYYETEKANNFINEKVAKPEQIDKKINSYIKDKEVVSINENFYIASGHNNGGQNTVIRSITVITK